MQRFGGLVNLNVHFHLLVLDGVFVEDDDRLAFALHPVPTSADVLAILDRIVRRIADEARDDGTEESVDLFAQVQAEAAATWRSPRNGKPTVRGVERLRAWTADGQIAYRLKRPWPDGRTELVLPPVAFLRRLCGIIPPPRRHLVRYAGVLMPGTQPTNLACPIPARW